MPAIIAVVLRFVVYFGAMLVGAIVTAVASMTSEWFAKRKREEESMKEFTRKRDL